MPYFDELTEFNPGIIYALVPNASPEQLAGSQRFVDFLFPQMGQHLDLLDAYMYAQETILPILRTTASTVTKEQFVEWIKAIHKRMGKTVLGFIQQPSGEFAAADVFIWRKSEQVQSELAEYLAEMHTTQSDQSFAHYLLEKYNIDIQDTLDLLMIINKVKDDKSISFSESQSDFLRTITHTPFFRPQIALYRLIGAYQRSILTDEEKLAVEKVVRICMSRDQVPGAMDAFAEKTLARFAECNPDNYQQIADFLADVFYEFSDIHPFGNRNGGTALCLINIFLRSLNLPSIILKFPGEANDDSSLYSIAFNAINVSRKPLAQLILTRINAEIAAPYADAKLQLKLELKLKALEGLKKILAFSIDYNIDEIEEKTMRVPRRFSPSEIEILRFERLNKLLPGIIASLNQSKPLRPVLLTTEQKAQLSLCLKQISGHDGWKINCRAGITAWFESRDKTIARDVNQALRIIPADIAKKIVMGTRPDAPDIWIVKCEQIDFGQVIDSVGDRLAENYSDQGVRPR